MDLVISFPSLPALCSHATIWHSWWPRAERGLAFGYQRCCRSEAGRISKSQKAPPDAGVLAPSLHSPWKSRSRAGSASGERQHRHTTSGKSNASCCQTPWCQKKKTIFDCAADVWRKLPQCDQLQICLTSFMSGRANGIRVTCGRAGEVFTRWLCWQRFARPMETLHLQSRRLAEKTFFSCPVFPMFLFCLLLRTLRLGGNPWVVFSNPVTGS